MQTISAVAQITTTTPVLICQISSDVLGMSAIASGQATINFWQQTSSGQVLNLLSGMVLPTYGAMSLSHLIKAVPFFAGDKFYASCASGQATVALAFLLGVTNQRSA